MQFVCAVLLAGVLFTAPATARPRGTVSAQTSGEAIIILYKTHVHDPCMPLHHSVACAYMYVYRELC